jgi:hypothetical protein
MSIKLPNVEAILAVDNKFGLAKQGIIPWKNKSLIIHLHQTLINLSGWPPCPNHVEIFDNK